MKSIACFFSNLSRLLFHLRIFVINSNVYPNPVPMFSCSVCTCKVTRRGRSVQCFSCLHWVHLKCATFLIAIQLSLPLSLLWLFFLLDHGYEVKNPLTFFLTFFPSQSISYRYHKSKPSSVTILAPNDFC